MAETSSGAFLANDCLVHFTVSALPFGGVGESPQALASSPCCLSVLAERLPHLPR